MLNCKKQESLDEDSPMKSRGVRKPIPVLLSRKFPSKVNFLKKNKKNEKRGCIFFDFFCLYI